MRLTVLVWSVTLLSLANGGLAVALYRKATEKRPILVIPGVSSRAILPNEISREHIRDFAALYVLHFDNYTPATIDAVTEDALSKISPRFWTHAQEMLERRRNLVRESRLASHVALDKIDLIHVEDTDEEWHVAVPARRRTYIADKLSRDDLVIYQLTLERMPPTSSNPYGLCIVGQTIEEQKHEKGIVDQ